jgi:hypothetical protein
MIEVRNAQTPRCGRRFSDARQCDDRQSPSRVRCNPHRARTGSRSAVTYQPPSGWVEPRGVAIEDEESELIYGIFHSRQDCQRVRRPELLRLIDKPYSAARCSLCAPAA